MLYLCIFSVGAFPISPAVYGGTPAPILFESLACEVLGDVDGDERLEGGLLEGELPDGLIGCRFGSFATSVANPPRLVGVRCNSEFINVFPTESGQTIESVLMTVYV